MSCQRARCLFCAALLVYAGAGFSAQRDIGLVLGSGGFKGAYHLGVWRALTELGLTNRIAAISGTSTGAICSALFSCISDPDEQERVWESTPAVFQLNPELSDVKRIYMREAERKRAWYGVLELSPALSNELWRSAEVQARREMIPRITFAAHKLQKYPDSEEVRPGVASSKHLRQRFAEILPESFSSTAPKIYATALKCGKDSVVRTFCLNKMSKMGMIDALCASAAIPVVFQPVEIDGVFWQDGGWVDRGGDAMPITPVLDNHREVKYIIAVYLDNESSLPKGQRAKVLTSARKNNVRLLEIMPSRNIGGPLGGWFGVFDSTHDTMRDLFDLGRSDALKVLSDGCSGL